MLQTTIEWLHQSGLLKAPTYTLLGALAAGLGMFLLIKLLLLFTRKTVVIHEYETGLLYKNGIFAKNLPPGKHHIRRWGRTVQVLDKRASQVVVSSQEILTADPIPLKVSAVATYEVVDPAKALHTTQSYMTTFYGEVQLALRQAVAGKTLDELLTQRLQLRESLIQALTPRAESIGLRVLTAEVRDVILPTELKKAFSESVRAQKEGLAALERARGESAALRHLANAAKMLENNPHLLELRILQTLSPQAGGGGNTLVWGVPPSSAGFSSNDSSDRSSPPSSVT